MEIKKEIIDAFNNVGISVDVSTNENLSDVIGDSLMFVSLIVEVEDRLGIEIPSEYLNIDNFSTIESFVSVIEKIETMQVNNLDG